MIQGVYSVVRVEGFICARPDRKYSGHCSEQESENSPEVLCFQEVVEGFLCDSSKASSFGKKHNVLTVWELVFLLLPTCDISSTHHALVGSLSIYRDALVFASST